MPESDQEITPKFEVGPIPQSILDVETHGDFIYDTVKTIAPEIGGYDDVLLKEGSPAMDVGRVVAVRVAG